MLEKYKVIDSTVTTFITITVVEWFDLPAGRQVCLYDLFTVLSPLPHEMTRV